MTAQSLLPHPADPDGPVKRLEGACSPCGDGAFSFRFDAAGEIARLRIPVRASAARRDELWRTTCFEAFVGNPEGGYLELNFSPSSAWAAYDFTAYREGMAESGAVASVAISTNRAERKFTLTANVRFADARRLFDPGSLKLGFAAVIEDIDGARSH